MLLQQATLSSSVVQRCHSQICLACNETHREPTFVSCPRFNPSDIRQLPKRWWDQEERVFESSLLEIMSRTLTNLYECYAPQPWECGCVSDSDSTSTVPWFYDSYSPRGHWRRHGNGPHETKVDRAMANSNLFVGQTLTTFSTDHEDNNNIDNDIGFEVPFDEY